MTTPPLQLATTPAGNALLAGDPLALLIGMLLDQQFPMERAFTAPSLLHERLGLAPDQPFDPAALAEHDAEAFVELFRTPPALHRYPAAMAARVQELGRLVVDEYGGDAARLWREAGSGAELAARLGRLPGFGAQKARIFTALLGKQLGVQPPGWREAAGAYGEPGSFRSIADVVDADSLVKVRTFKKEQKAAAKARAAG